MGNESTPHANGGAGADNNNNTTTTNTTPSADFLNSASTTEVRPGGAPARVYLNEKVVPYLLEGMKTITKEQ